MTIKHRIRSLETRSIEIERSWVFTRTEPNGRIASIWARSTDGKEWPADEEFDPPIAAHDLPDAWKEILASCNLTRSVGLDGVFGGVVGR